MVNSLEELRGQSVCGTAADLGLTVAANGKSVGPCPSCNMERRNNSGRAADGRLRCRVHDDAYWACCSNGSTGCGAAGTAVDLAAWVLLGRALFRGDVRGWRKVFDWFSASRGSIGAPPVRPVCTPLARRRLDPVWLAQTLLACRRVDCDVEVAEYLRGRRIAPEAVAEASLAFALPPAFWSTPTHARGEQWADSGHRLLFPMYEPAHPTSGQFIVAGLHARCVRPIAPDRKAAWAYGGDATGLVMVIDMVGPWADGVERELITVVEGGPDFLTMAQAPPAKRGALIGSVSGSAQASVVAAMPANWTVVLALHDDDGGRQQRRAWERELRGRNPVRHFDWGALDVGDHDPTM